MASVQPVKEGVKWECPICLQVPSKKIFLCSNGHSICSLCIAKVKTCPNCRFKMSVFRKQRNYGLEEVLDLIKLKCCWDGCNKKFSRSLISEHEEQCSFNPNALKLCNSMRYRKCNFQFTLASTTADPKFQRVIEHLRSCHAFVQGRRLKLDARYFTFISMRRLESRHRHRAKKYRHGNHFEKQLITFKYKDRKHMFLRVTRISMNDLGQEMLSISFVQLTPDPVGGKKFTFNLSIKCVSKQDTTSMWGIRPIKIDKFIEFNKNPKAEQRSLPCPMPVSHLEKHFTDGNKRIGLTYCVELN